jgi:XTP/dITP diphosphohydrolase
MKIVLASNNSGKVNELSSYLRDFKLDIIPQDTMGVESIAETGLTFIENALLKARHASYKTGLSAIADDSGLVVPALKGAPGIYSARYAGEQASDGDNIKKLLAELASYTGKQREAYFYCILVYLTNEQDPVPSVGQGAWHGTILLEPKGDRGFGYDPVFFVMTENKTAAELSTAVKNSISHRGQALRSLVERLAENMDLENAS